MELSLVEAEVANEERKLATSFALYKNDPVAFAREVLGLRLWSRQEELLLACATHSRVAVRSGHKVGKSTAACALALWWVCTRPSGRVVLTSASGRQVRSILWRELRRLHREARTPIGGDLHDVPDAGLQFADGREVVGFSTDKPERFAGISGHELLFIVDEASGVPETIFEALEGNRAGGARVVMLSNPTQTSGTFFDAFHTRRSFWKTLHISSEEASKVTPPVPGLATKDWVLEKQSEWGKDSPIYGVRCGGEFPKEGTQQVISLAALSAALDRWEETEAGDTLEIGLDVARFGDDETVFCPRLGSLVMPLEVLPAADGINTAGRARERALQIAKEAKITSKPRIKVDVIGVGAGVFDTLSRFDDIEVVAVNSANTADDEKLYANLRAQLHFGVREFLAEGSIPHDAKLEAEIVTPLYAFDARGRYVVESKKEIKARVGRSPDRFDALALAVYSPARMLDAVPMPDSEEEDRWGSDARSW